MVHLGIFLTKLNIHSSRDPAISLLRIFPREMKTCVYRKNPHAGVYSRFICNLQKLETRQIPFIWRMHKSCGICIPWNTAQQVKKKKKRNKCTYENMNGSQNENSELHKGYQQTV